MEYRYAHFKRKLLMEDMGFSAGPPPGEPMAKLCPAWRRSLRRSSRRRSAG
jgi:hypothetical protein